MIRPPLALLAHAARASRTQVKVPRRWTLMTASKSSSVIFHSVVVAQDAGVGDQDVQPAELADRRSARVPARPRSCRPGRPRRRRVPPAAVIDCDGLAGDRLRRRR